MRQGATNSGSSLPPWSLLLLADMVVDGLLVPQRLLKRKRLHRVGEMKESKKRLGSDTITVITIIFVFLVTMYTTAAMVGC